MRHRRPPIAALLALPALLLIGWFVAEQLPAWLAPPPPWVRYPDLVALPGGCEAAVALANAGASRTEKDTPSDSIAASLEESMRAQLSQVDYELLATPQAVRYEDEDEGWFSLLAFAQDDEQILTRGAVVFMNSDGSIRDIVYLIGGDATRGTRCGDFAPQPRGLRAQLRPYLPLTALAGYAFVVGVGVVGWRLFRRKTER
jgi:hypothetical protein